MSVEAFAIALHHSRSKGATLLVLIGIANHDGDGGAWPSVRTLARYARVSESQVQRAVSQLESLGEIRRYVQQGGDQNLHDWRRPNRYAFLLACPDDCDRTKHHRTVRTSAVEIADLAPDVDFPTYPQSYPQRVAPMRPGRTHATGTGRTHATQTRTDITHRSPIETGDSTREGFGACGHALITTDPRHCVVGCLPEKVRPS